MHDYDDWKLSNGLEKEEIYAYCAECGGDIYKGQEYLKTDVGNFCNYDCIETFMNIKYRIAGEK